MAGICSKVRIHFSAIAVLAVLAAVPCAFAYAADSTEDDGESREYGAPLSQGQKNIVLRARQAMEIEWSPLLEIEAYGEYSNFMPGEVYRGLPYGRPNNANHYVPCGTSFQMFLSALENPDNPIYTTNDTRDSPAPYYSSDCSSFISWAWGLDKVYKTVDLHLVADEIGTELNDIEVGDVFNNPAYHVVLISHVERDADGNLVRVGTMELDAPMAKQTWYGAGENQPIGRLKEKYLSNIVKKLGGSEDGEEGSVSVSTNGGYNGYVIFRYKDRDNVKYVHDCSVPIDDDHCYDCISPERMWVPRVTEAMEVLEAKLKGGRG